MSLTSALVIRMALDEITTLYNSNKWKRHPHDTWEAYVRENLPHVDPKWPPSIRRIIVQRIVHETSMTIKEIAVTLASESAVIEQDILELSQRHG